MSPYYADFTGFSPTYFEVSTEEMLFDDSIRTHEKMLRQGVDSRLKVSLRIVAPMSWIPLFHSACRCGNLLSVAAPPALSYLHILFVLDAICQWSVSTSTTAITVGRRSVGKVFPVLLSLLDAVEWSPLSADSI